MRYSETHKKAIVAKDMATMRKGNMQLKKELARKEKELAEAAMLLETSEHWLDGKRYLLAEYSQ